MRALEYLGIGREKSFRVSGEHSHGRSARSTFDEPIKGMTPQVKPALDPRITDAIVASMPTPPEKRRMVGTYAKWISDPIINPAEANPEFVNVLRAVVSDDKPLPIDQVADMAGTEKDRVEDLVRNVPFISVDTVNGQTQLDMPDVQTYIAQWKGKAIQKLPEGAEPGIVSQLLTPSPTTETTVFDRTKELHK